MASRVAGKTHIFPSLSEDLMTGRNGCTVGPESAQGKVFPVMNKSLDGFGKCHSFVHHFFGFLLEKCSCTVRIRIGK